MIYNQPVGGSSNDPYVTGNPATGTPGSIPSGAAIEQPQREIVHAIITAGLSPSATDLTQLAQAIEAMIATAIASIPSEPAGFVKSFAGTIAPAGYLACPATNAGGANLVSRTTYAALFAAIDTTWGAGDGVTTFGIPYYPAGYAIIAGSPGSLNVGQVINHVHASADGTGFLDASGGTPHTGIQYVGGGGNYADSNSNTGNPTTGNAANLPAGVNNLICIKY